MDDDESPDTIPHRYADRPPFPRVADAMADRYAVDDSGHDAHHAWRVLHLSMQLADEVPEPVDETVLGVAALVHDCHRTMAEDGGVAPRESLDEVRSILDVADVPADLVDPVVHCVAVHDDYDYRGDPDRTESVEARILQDADNLDAMGAVGVARNFAFTALHGNSMWDPSGETYSGLSHFEDKLLKLPDEMYTDAARAIAEERAAFLREYRDRFRREWFGEDVR